MHNVSNKQINKKKTPQIIERSSISFAQELGPSFLLYPAVVKNDLSVAWRLIIHSRGFVCSRLVYVCAARGLSLVGFSPLDRMAWTKSQIMKDGAADRPARPVFEKH